MSRIVRMIAVAVCAGLLVLTAACSARIDIVMPDVAKVQATPLGQVLKKLGYTPVTMWYNGDKPIGYIYVACGDNPNLTQCGEYLHVRNQDNPPNLYATTDGKVLQLEGQRLRKSTYRNYYVSVPPAYQDFMSLTERQRQDLLGIMPVIVQGIGVPINNDSGESAINTRIGVVQAWAASQ